MKFEKKYIIPLLFVAALLWYPFTQGDSNTSIEQMQEAISPAIENGRYQALDEKQLRKHFEIHAEETAGFLAYRSKDAMSAETLVILRLRQQEDADALIEKLQEYIESEHKKYDGYSADQVGILDNYTMVEKKGYIFLSISKHHEWKQIFEKNL